MARGKPVKARTAQPVPTWVIAGKILEQLLLELGPPENGLDSARRAALRAQAKKYTQ